MSQLITRTAGTTGYTKNLGKPSLWVMINAPWYERRMAAPSYALLEDRGLIAVEGEDARGFLQGLVSNDVDKVGAGCAVHLSLIHISEPTRPY